MRATRFELLLFSTDVPFVRAAVRAGIDGVVVDWERAGKRRRQRWFDTEINSDTLADLKRVRAATDGAVLCRVNAYGPSTSGELKAAVDAGADEVLLPMVRSTEDVRRTLDDVNGRCRLGILVETRAAVKAAGELARLPLSRVYVGLNDLAIERGTPNIFTAVADGTVPRLRPRFTAPFGFGGLTLPEAGDPIPCRLLIGEMARLDCRFSFLRRSFRRDVPVAQLDRALALLRAALAAARARSDAEVRRDHAALVAAVAGWTRQLTAEPATSDV